MNVDEEEDGIFVKDKETQSSTSPNNIKDDSNKENLLTPQEASKEDRLDHNREIVVQKKVGQGKQVII